MRTRCTSIGARTAVWLLASSPALPPVAAGSTQRIEVRTLGSTLTGSWNGVQVVQAVETFQQTATRHGLDWNASFDFGARFDNLEIRGAAPVPVSPPSVPATPSPANHTEQSARRRTPRSRGWPQGQRATTSRLERSTRLRRRRPVSRVPAIHQRWLVPRGSILARDGARCGRIDPRSGVDVHDRGAECAERAGCPDLDCSRERCLRPAHESSPELGRRSGGDELRPRARDGEPTADGGHHQFHRLRANARREHDVFLASHGAERGRYDTESGVVLHDCRVPD